MEYISRYYYRGGGGSADAAAGEGGASAAPHATAANAPSTPSHPSSSGSRHQPAHHHAADPEDRCGHPGTDGDSGNDYSPRSNRKRYDPWERFRELEEELFKLKFEQAHMLEEEDGAALRERRDREKAEVLRERLWALKVEIRGERRPDGGDGAGAEEKDENDDDCDGGDDGYPEEEASAPLVGGAGRDFDDGGLRRRRDKMDTNVRRLKRDVDILRADVESVRSNADRIESDLDTAQQERDRVLAKFNEMESKGEDLNNEVTRLQFSARQAVRCRVEVTLQKETSDDETAQLRGKCEALRVELEQLRERVTMGGDDARDFRADAERNRKSNDRIRDKILMTTNPEEYRKRKAEERRRKKLEGKMEGRRTSSVGGGKDKIGRWLSRSVRSVTTKSAAGDLAGHSPSRALDGIVLGGGMEKETYEEGDGHDDHDDGISVATGRYTVA